ncbi:ATP-binding protein [Novosphingobium piscinae]|uniref:histidine kinase n=1 Tax=Novosphingobium piscinae TaxID=1507448 RepID=A0A7X1FVK6_9SPHN|nr:ATP-binding protein [Novosphingobium piscinae]MBC2667756.1 DUF4118 domain-containing protein [Novosphingobium piscinae]
MTRTFGSSLLALGAVGVVTAVSVGLLPVLGLASAALLFLLPVLLGAARGGLWPGLVATLAGASAYNFFLLEPRYSFRVHQLDSLVSVAVLGVVAAVTSRLATRLMAREAEANARAAASEEAARLSALLAAGPADEALGAGLAFVAARYAPVYLLDGALPAGSDAGFSSLDLSAAAWALHNGDRTGHGTETMAAADWSFIPLALRSRSDQAVLALARPSDGHPRSPAELDQLQQLALLLGACRDRASLEQVRRDRERLEQSEQLRRTFLASLAHDFRTPLTVITGQLAQLAQRDPAAADALVAAGQLERTMADLLGLARIEDGSLVVASESLDVIDSVGAACDAVALPAGITLQRAVPTDLPFVRGDPVMLHHALANLVDNAMRHAHTTVRVSAAGTAERVEIVVEDDGSGIPAADRAEVFDRFRRLAGSDRTAGSGLGLAIVKGFTEAMGGDVSIGESPLGGARFALGLPGVPEPVG